MIAWDHVFTPGACAHPIEGGIQTRALYPCSAQGLACLAPSLEIDRWTIHLALPATTLPLVVYPPSPPSYAVMASLIDSIKSLSDLSNFSRRSNPIAPDGLTDTEAAASVLNKPEEHGKLFSIIDSLQDSIKRGVPIEFDKGTIVCRVSLEWRVVCSRATNVLALVGYSRHPQARSEHGDRR